MATTEVLRPETTRGDSAHASPDVRPRDVAKLVLAPLASLRLTVVLFAMSIFLVFVGTLAQKDHDIWYVLHGYFRTWIAIVEFRTFERLVQVFNNSVDWKLTGSFPFPGGKIIGLLLLVNLFAAHAVRFRVAARGRRLSVGLGVLALGVLATALAIASGMNDTIESELSLEFCHGLWQVFRGALAVLALAGANLLWYTYGRIRPVEWRVLLAVVVAIAALAAWLLLDPSVRLDNSGLRILWQLFKGAGAGLVLLAGAILVFRKPGIVLLHGGVALIMLGELWTAIAQQESIMEIAEGQTVSHSVDGRSSELAVIDSSPADHNQVTIVSPKTLARNVRRPKRIESAELPFSIKVLSWLPNSRLRRAGPNTPTPATAGAGLGYVADEVPLATGKKGDERNLPSAYIELFSKQTGESLGTYLVGVPLLEQDVAVDERTYQIALRFKEIYFPYSLTLVKFNFGKYTGTNTAKDYSSLVQLRDPERNVNRAVKIWMNNPLRYAGTTFYQLSFDEVTEKSTVLQVVSNATWMTPYVGCMLVAIGMLFHFGVMLVRFVRRQVEHASPLASAGSMHTMPPPLPGQSGPTIGAQKKRSGARPPHADSGPARTGDDGALAMIGRWLPAIVVAACALVLSPLLRMPKSGPSEMQIYEFAKLPVSFQGRIKPYDTLARNSLQFLSGRQRLKIEDRDGNERTEPAIRWLLDVISGAVKADDYRIFRVENLDLLNTLGLEQRAGSWRYSLNELRSKEGVLDQQIELAAAEAKAERPLSLYQRKVLQLSNKYNYYTLLFAAFRSPLSLPDAEQMMQQAGDVQPVILSMLKSAPHAVPPDAASVDWTPLLAAELSLIEARMSDQPVNMATLALRTMLDAYARGDAATFNQQLAEYRRILTSYEKSLVANTAELKANGAKPAEIYSQAKSRFEVFFNQFSPFLWAGWLYVFAFVLGALSWLGWTMPLRRSSIWLLWFTFAIHTFALVARIYISGRPPVTNLYSSAVFIGWAGVLLGLTFEAIYRLGLGNIVAAVGGFLTLLVAHFLSLDGDTLIVLQAVLDTQFWLATHVVCITLGYATTYLAGMLGIAYILLAHVFPVLGEHERRELTRMIYGTLCFAILFSFVGTVLGGLWGDDSWGRFWGWDPKENGALIIVLYNALVLHARFGGMVKARGLATLVVGGNIVVTWSYFGVNELGVGLHAYGASERATAMWLLVFAASQMALVALGAMPRRWFEAIGGARSDA